MNEKKKKEEERKKAEGKLNPQPVFVEQTNYEDDNFDPDYEDYKEPNTNLEDSYNPKYNEMLSKIMSQEKSYNNSTETKPIVKKAVPTEPEEVLSGRAVSSEGFLIDFSETESIRKAVIYSEILGKPKSLSRR